MECDIYEVLKNDPCIHTHQDDGVLKNKPR